MNQEEQIKQLIRERQSAEVERNRQIDRATAAREEANQWRSRHEVLQRQFRELSAKQEATEAKVVSITNERIAAQAAVTAADARTSGMGERLAEAQKRIEVLTTAAAGDQATFVAELQKDNAAAWEEWQKSEHANAALTAQLSELKAEHQALAEREPGYLRDLSELRLQIKSLEEGVQSGNASQLAELGARLAEASKVAERLRGELAESQKRLVEANRLKLEADQRLNLERESFAAKLADAQKATVTKAVTPQMSQPAEFTQEYILGLKRRCEQAHLARITADEEFQKVEAELKSLKSSREIRQLKDWTELSVRNAELETELQVLTGREADAQAMIASLLKEKAKPQPPAPPVVKSEPAPVAPPPENELTRLERAIESRKSWRDRFTAVKINYELGIENELKTNNELRSDLEACRILKETDKCQALVDEIAEHEENIKHWSLYLERMNQQFKKNETELQALSQYYEACRYILGNPPQQVTPLLNVLPALPAEGPEEAEESGNDPSFAERTSAPPPTPVPVASPVADLAQRHGLSTKALMLITLYELIPGSRKNAGLKTMWDACKHAGLFLTYRELFDAAHEPKVGSWLQLKNPKANIFGRSTIALPWRPEDVLNDKLRNDYVKKIAVLRTPSRSETA